MDNNPLRQYFRRPAVYIKLPSGGKGYPEGAIDMPETGELPVFPMTAIDEITTRTPDALFNGTAVTELIRSCVPNIKDPWAVNSSDLDAVLISIKAASGTENLDLDSVCPKCQTETSYGVNLVGILSSLKPGDYDALFETNNLKIKFRPLTYTEMNKAAMAQFEVQQIFNNLENEEDPKKREEISFNALERITMLTIEILSLTIEYIETPSGRVDENDFIVDFLKNCDRKLYTDMRDYNTKLRSDAEVKPMQVKCPNCSHEYEQPITLNPTDFFE